MKTSFLLLAALLCLGAVAESQTVSPTPSTQTAPAAEGEKKPGFFQRLFKKKPTPTPVPTATPEPTPVRKKKMRRTPKPSPTPGPLPDAAATSAPSEPAAPAPNMGDSQLPPSLPPLDQPASTPAELPGAENSQPSSSDDAAASTPAPAAEDPTTSLPEPDAEVKANPFNQAIPIIGEAANSPAAIQIPARNELAEKEQQAADQAKFRKLKAEALADPKLQELKAGADSAATMAARYEGLKKFYPALFAKMRQIDKSQAPLIDAMEAAAQRRLQRMLAEGSGDQPPE